MNTNVEKVTKIFDTRILTGFPSPSAKPIAHTREATACAPRGILYSDGTVALFLEGWRVTDNDVTSSRAYWVADVLHELQMISAEECVDFKAWSKLQTDENLRDFCIENLYSEAERLGYKVVPK